MIYIAFGFVFFAGYMFGLVTVAMMSANDEKKGDQE